MVYQRTPNRACDGLRTAHVAHWPIFHVVIRSSSKASAVRRFVVASVMTFLRPVGRSARAEPVAKCRGRTTLAPVPDDDDRISDYDALMIAGLGTYTCAALPEIGGYASTPRTWRFRTKYSTVSTRMYIRRTCARVSGCARWASYLQWLLLLSKYIF